jgi:glutaconate CoA-transferase subunit A
MSKVMSMREAISQFVHSGDTIFFGGMRHGEATAAIHEIARQRIDHLTMIGALITMPSILIGEGLIDKVHTGTHTQLAADPNASGRRSYPLMKAREMNKYPEFIEYSHFGISLALMAGHMGVSYLPTKSHLGTDFLKYNPNIKVVECPFTGEKMAAVKAVIPDVGLIHVQQADANGNAQKWGSLGVDREGINACKSVIVTTEKIVDSDVIRRNPNMTLVPGFLVKAVVEQPWGAYPQHLAGFYHGDAFSFNAELGRSEGYETYVREMVYGVRDWNEYLVKRRETKGEDHFTKLAIRQRLVSEPIITGY